MQDNRIRNHIGSNDLVTKQILGRGAFGEVILVEHNNVATGQFGADMKVTLLNDGPVTIFIDTKNKE